jgi:hypothetical protein
MPSVSTLSVSTDMSQIVFTGSNFPTSSYTATATYNGIDSSSATIDSST